MDLLVGGETQRTVIWVGAPTMQDDDRDKAVVEINRVMAEEAAKRAPDVVYFDAYALFADEDGEYTRIDVPIDAASGDDRDESAGRVGDGVHRRGVHFTRRRPVPRADRCSRCSTSGTASRAQADPTRADQRAPSRKAVRSAARTGSERRRRLANDGTTPTTRRRSGNTGNQGGDARHDDAPSDADEDDAPPATDAPAPTQPPATTTTGNAAADDAAHASAEPVARVARPRASTRASA